MHGVTLWLDRVRPLIYRAFIPFAALREPLIVAVTFRAETHRCRIERSFDRAPA
jgi:hypothetical protein